MWRGGGWRGWGDEGEVWVEVCPQGLQFLTLGLIKTKIVQFATLFETRRLNFLTLIHFVSRTELSNSKTVITSWNKVFGKKTNQLIKQKQTNKKQQRCCELLRIQIVHICIFGRIPVVLQSHRSSQGGELHPPPRSAHAVFFLFIGLKATTWPINKSIYLKSLRGIEVPLSIQARGSCMKRMTKINLKSKMR